MGQRYRQLKFPGPDLSQVPGGQAVRNSPMPARQVNRTTYSSGSLATILRMVSRGLVQIVRNGLGVMLSDSRRSAPWFEGGANSIRIRMKSRAGTNDYGNLFCSSVFCFLTEPSAWLSR